MILRDGVFISLIARRTVYRPNGPLTTDAAFEFFLNVGAGALLEWIGAAHEKEGAS